MADPAIVHQSETGGVTLDDLLDIIRSEDPDVDTALVERAHAYARDAHGDTRRRSGELYITHPIEVAIILARMELDSATLAAALLHDVVEDTDRTIEDITDLFGTDVANLVEGVTKLGRIAWSTEHPEERAEREKARQDVPGNGR